MNTSGSDQQSKLRGQQPSVQTKGQLQPAQRQDQPHSGQVQDTFQKQQGTNLLAPSQVQLSSQQKDQAQQAQVQTPVPPPDEVMSPSGSPRIDSQSSAHVGRVRDSGQPTSQPTVQPIADKPVDISQGRPSGAKEAEFVGGGVSVGENVPIVEVQEQGELSPEVEGWIERVKRDQADDMKPIIHKGKTYAQPLTAKKVQITLPLDQSGIKRGMHHKVFDSVRWLAEWCSRLVLKYKGNVDYKRRDQ